MFISLKISFQGNLYAYDLYSLFKMKIDFLILYPSFLFHSKCSKFIKCACFHYFSSCQLSEKFTNLPLFCLKWREENYPEEELKSKLGHMMGLLFLILDSVLLAAAAAKLLQSCPTPCDPTDGSPPGSPVPGILQARTLEWAAISFLLTNRSLC